MSAVDNYDGPEIWSADKAGGRIVLRERRYKGSEIYLDLRLWVNGGATATGKGATFPPDLAHELGAVLIAYAKARKDNAV